MSALLIIGAIACLSLGYTLGALSDKRAVVIGWITMAMCGWSAVGVWLFS